MADSRRVRLRTEVDPELAGLRLDQAAAKIWPEYSRSKLAEWIRAGALTVDGRVGKPNARLQGGERLEVDAVLEARADSPEPQPISLDLLHEDDDLFVVDKPAGMVVHPGSGNPDGTLVNALLHRDPALETLPRAGLVHRLDKDTSGCLLVARTLTAHHRLVAALKRRDIHRHYLAVVWGEMIAGGHVDAALGRHPVDRRRQVVREDGRHAVTHYRVERRLRGATLLRVKLETGRTHQIRVHMAHAGWPLIGDPMYGRRGSPGGLTDAQRDAWRGFPRQALHACRLRFQHPVADEEIDVHSPMPADMQSLVDALADEDPDGD